MLSLKPFILKKPKNLDELVSSLKQASPKTRIMAGGTDLLPNLKHGLYDVDEIISLKKLRELKKIEVREDRIELFSLLTLNEISCNQQIEKRANAIFQASRQVASPQIRNVATIGGNICLDTRCLYFNQSEFWRSALGFCLKKDGCSCHVIKTGKRCVAAASNDVATALLAHDAEISILSPFGAKSLKLEDFYTNNGEKNNVLTEDQMLLSTSFLSLKNTLSGFFKLRHRNSIDFSMLSVAVRFSLDALDRLQGGRLVINALVAKPKVIDLSEYEGLHKTVMIEKVAEAAKQKCHPQTNICDDPSWRKQMVSYATKMAFNNAFL